MDSTNILINILPDNVDVSLLKTAKGIGSIVSSDTVISVNIVASGFSIVYQSSVFNQLCQSGVDMFINSIFDLVEANVTNSKFNVMLLYHYETEDRYLFDKQTAGNLFNMEMKMLDIIRNGRNKFQYVKTKSIVDAADTMSEILEKPESRRPVRNNVNNERIPSADNITDDQLRASARQVAEMNSWLGIDPGSADDGDYSWDDEDDKPKKDKDEKSKYSVKTSKSMKSSKSPKKEYKRHGVIIADKDAVKKDEKIIKGFLKEFIPGDQQWKKDFRSDLAERWVNTYAISNKDLKQAKRRQKKVVRETYQRQRKEDIMRALTFTNRIVSVPIDQWNDPRR